MALIDVFLRRAIRRGELTLTKPDGSVAVFGTPDAVPANNRAASSLSAPAK